MHWREQIFEYMNVKRRRRKYQLKGHWVLIEIEDNQFKKHWNALMIPTFILGERKAKFKEQIYEVNA